MQLLGAQVALLGGGSVERHTGSRVIESWLSRSGWLPVLLMMMVLLRLWGRNWLRSDWSRSSLRSGGRWATLSWGLLVTIDNKTGLPCSVFDYSLLAVGVDITVGSLDCSIIETSLLAETLACWPASGVVAELVVALERWADFHIVQLGLLSYLLRVRRWCVHRTNLACLRY